MINIWRAYIVTKISNVELLHISLWSVWRDTNSFDGILDSFKNLYGTAHEVQFPYAVTIGMKLHSNELEEKLLNRNPEKTKVYSVGQVYYIAEVVDDINNKK